MADLPLAHRAESPLLLLLNHESCLWLFDCFMRKGNDALWVCRVWIWSLEKERDNDKSVFYLVLAGWALFLEKN